MSCLRKKKAAPLARGIFVLAAVFALAGCRMDPPAPSGPGLNVPESRAPLGATMTLAGQVYEWVVPYGYVWNQYDNDYEWGLDWDNGEYEIFGGDRSVSPRFVDGRDLGGEGGIVGGQLGFSIGSPNILANIGSLFDGHGDTHDDFTIHPRAARAILFHGMETEDDGSVGWIQRLGSYVHETETGLTSALDEVFYVYVDREVRITGRGKSDSGAGFIEGASYSYAWSFGDINIVLEVGWNVIHVSSETTIEGGHFSQSVSMAAYDPGWVRWGMRE